MRTADSRKASRVSVAGRAGGEPDAVSVRLAWAALACLVVLAGCLVRDTEAPRFFRPESAALADTPADGAADDPSAAPAGSAGVRLRAVHAAPFLRERVAWRVEDVEYGLYEQRRWIELPARYVRRALVATLRRTGRVHLTDDVVASRLDVEILAFDEVLAPRHLASVVLAVSLRDPRRGTLLERTFTAEAPIDDADPAAMARAMGLALDDVTGQVAQAVATHLATAPVAASTPRPSRKRARPSASAPRRPPA